MTLTQLLSEYSARINLSLLILTVGLLMCRILPVLLLSPLLGGETTEPEVKIGVGLLLCIVLFPAVAPRMKDVPVSALPFVAVLFKELFIGLSLSFVVSMVFEAARVAGDIIDSQSGSAQAQVHVPQIAEQVPIFASFQLMLAIALFLTLDGHHVVIQVLEESLTALPLDSFPRFSHGVWGFFELILRVLREMMKLSIGLAAPAIIASLLAELSLGAINRVAPQLQVFFLAMAARPMVATLILFVAISFIIQRMALEFGHSLGMLREAVQLLR